MVADIILGVFLTGLVGFVLYLRGALQQEQERYNEAMNKLLEAEKAKKYAEAQFEFLQASIIQMLQRPVLATLTDAQVNNITGALMQYINSLKDPGKMN